MKIGKPIEYIAVKPDEVLERMRKDKENEAKGQIALVDSVKDDAVFGELELLHSSGIKHVDISEVSKSIVGRAAINKQVKQLMKDAQTSIVIVSDVHSTERSVKPLKSLMQSLRKKGVSVEVYGAYEKKIAKKLSGSSYTDYKTDSNFVLIDGKQVVFLVSSSGVTPEYEVAIWMESPFFVQALEMLFRMSVRK
jgi:sugar-specific transcriptional regulator TrmB